MIISGTALTLLLQLVLTWVYLCLQQGMSRTAVALQHITNYLSPVALILGIFAFAVDCHLERKM